MELSLVRKIDASVSEKNDLLIVVMEVVHDHVRWPGVVINFTIVVHSAILGFPGRLHINHFLIICKAAWGWEDVSGDGNVGTKIQRLDVTVYTLCSKEQCIGWSTGGNMEWSLPGEAWKEHKNQIGWSLRFCTKEFSLYLVGQWRIAEEF